MIALRDRDLCANRPVLSGFDVVRIEIADRDRFHQIVARWDKLGLERTEVWDGGHYGLSVDLHDPDGTALRFVCDDPIGRTKFSGVAYNANGQVTYYDAPKLADH